MSDLPGYQRRIAHEGGSASPDVGGAVADFGKTIMPKQNVVADIVGQLGKQVAQSASNERARLAGIEAAKTPGRTLLPAIGESDAEFVKAYRYETVQNGVMHANQLFSKLGTAALKNPTGKSLQEFDQYANKGMQELLQQVDEKDRPDFQREMMNAYQGNLQKIGQAVEKRNGEVLEANRNAQIIQRSNNIQNFALDGNFAGAQKEYQSGMAAIAKGEELFKSGSSSGIPADEALKQREKLKDMLLIATTQGQALKAAKENKSEEFLANLRRNKPEGVSASDHELMVQGAKSYLNNYNSALSGQQEVNYINLQSQIDTGKMTPDMMAGLPASGKVDEVQFAQLQSKFNAQIAKQNQKAERIIKISKDVSDPVAMANYSEEEKNDWFDNRLSLLEQSKGAQPGELGVEGETMIAQSMRSPISSYIKRMEAGIQSSDPEIMAQWSKAMNVMQNNNPDGLRKLDSNARAVANLYNSYSANSMFKGETAAEKALNSVYNIDEDTKTARRNSLKQWYKDKDIADNPKAKSKHIAEGIGAKNPWYTGGGAILFPEKLNTIYDTNMPSYIERCVTPELAEKQLFEDLKQIYRESSTNNRREIMANPPDAYISNWKNWRENDKVQALKSYVFENERLENEGQFVLNSVKWKDAPNTENLLTDKPLVEGDLIIQVDGKDRKVIVNSDQVTSNSPEGRPSWSFWYLDDNGVPQPLLDSANGSGNARWRPDYDRLEAEKKKYPMLKIQEAQERLDRFNDEGAIEYQYDSGPPIGVNY